MSDAINWIVNSYVSLKDREALETLREHRQKLRKQLQERSTGVFNVGYSIRTLDDDLAYIEAGLTRLQS